MNLLKKIIDWCFNEATGGNQYDSVVNLRPTMPAVVEIVPFARTDVPNLGPDHAALVARAEVLYPSDVLRYKWLMAIHRLRNETKRGWILKPNTESSNISQFPIAA